MSEHLRNTWKSVLLGSLMLLNFLTRTSHSSNWRYWQLSTTSKLVIKQYIRPRCFRHLIARPRFIPIPTYIFLYKIRLTDILRLYLMWWNIIELLINSANGIILRPISGSDQSWDRNSIAVLLCFSWRLFTVLSATGAGRVWYLPSRCPRTTTRLLEGTSTRSSGPVKKRIL